MMVRVLAASLSLLVFVNAEPVNASTDPADKCVLQKAKATGKKAQSILKALGKNISKNPDTKLGLATSKAESKFTKAFTKAEAKGSCATTGDAGAIGSKVNAFAASIVASFDAGEAVQGSVGDGGTVTTDTEADGATPADPLETTVTSPNAGQISITEGSTQVGGGGFQLASQQAAITAPGATPGDPLIIVFLLDSSEIPPGADETTMQVFRDGTVVQACWGSSGEAQPDPCVSDRALAGGDVELTVLTTAASDWTFGTLDVSECRASCQGQSLLSFTTGSPPGVAGGELRSFECSNDLAVPCTDDSDCDFGSCLFGVVCEQNSNVSCTASGTECQGTCEHRTDAGSPRPLALGGLYVGGGFGVANWPPSARPLPVPDQATFSVAVTSYDAAIGSMTLGPTSPTDFDAYGARQCTQGRRCSGGGSPCIVDTDCPSTETCEARCFFGPPLPIYVGGSSQYLSGTCFVVDVAEDVSGVAQCDGGATQMTVPLRFVAYGSQDLLTNPSPPSVLGGQPCPLCDRQCVGGGNVRYPCTASSDCDSGVCDTDTRCLGGPNDGLACIPGTSRLDVHECCDGGTDHGERCGSSGPSTCPSGICRAGCTSYPTSHDCPPDPASKMTAQFGGIDVELVLTSGSATANAVHHPAVPRTFFGFCRDALGASTLAFEGDPDGPPCIGCTLGTGVPCASDDDCNDGDEYESCVQRSPGAFGWAPATRIEVHGATDAACLGDGATHESALVSIFEVPPVFARAILFDARLVDAALDLPGPGAILLSGSATLASGTSVTTTTSASTTTTAPGSIDAFGCLCVDGAVFDGCRDLGACTGASTLCDSLCTGHGGVQTTPIYGVVCNTVSSCIFGTCDGSPSPSCGGTCTEAGLGCTDVGGTCVCADLP